MTRGTAYTLGFAWLAVSACAPDQNASNRGAQVSRALAAVDGLASHDPRVARLVAAREGAFRRVVDTEGEDAESRGRIVSEGWRSTQEKRFSDLGARLPDTADGPMDVGLSRFSDRHVHVTLAGASSVSGRVEQGRVVYVGALASTDRVIVSNRETLEEFLVLQDARAPRAFTWNIQLPEAVARVTEREGGLLFEDARGKPLLAMPAPYARDAHHEAVALTTRWDASAHALTVALPEIEESAALAYPLIVDPRYETSVWIDAATRFPPVRQSAAMAYDSLRDEVVVFGGDGVGVGARETWIWKGATRTWAQRTPPVSPPTRYAHAMAFDSGRGEVVLFGGFSGGVDFNDTWVWSGAASTWTQRAPATSPAPRSKMAMTYDSARSEIVLFGGVTGITSLGDTWAWNGAASTWTQRLPASSPAARADHAMTFDTARSEVVLFGGSLFTSARANDTWGWNGATSTWTQRAPTTRPSPRDSHGMAYDAARDEIVIFGGRASASVSLDETWVWNGAASNWAQRSTPSRPSTRYGHAMVFEAARGEVFVFAGHGAGGRLADAWTWSGATSTWTQRPPLLAPPARLHYAMAYDSARGEVVMFGGMTGAVVPLNETWVWTGATSSWLQRTPASQPLGRISSAMVFDSARGEIVLFGGYGTTALSDTWIWNGAASSWTQRAPAVSPPARHNHAMVFDSVRGEAVLFGGRDTPGISFDETWTWNGVTWVKRLPLASPPARSAHAMAFDAARGEVVLFGGIIATTFFDDTWIWNGAASSWAQRSPVIAPAARYDHAMTYDSVRGDVVLFAGFTGSLLNDTWVWSGAASSWSQRTSVSTPAVRSTHEMVFDSARGEAVTFSTSSTNDTWLHSTIGGTCTTHAECAGARAFCTDGVCCNAAACGTCATCAGASPGRCTDILNTEDPDTCALRDGKSCSGVADCKTALGATAANATECASGYLVDGVCCDGPCNGTCQACRSDLKDSEERSGICGNAKAGTDPRDSCAADPHETCQRDGACDGRGACRLHVFASACGPVACLGNRSSSRICDGRGACGASVEGVDCGAYQCAENMGCATTCAGDSDCAPLHHCEASVCVVDRGAACDGDHTVTSPNGKNLDCGLYKCEGASCKATCRRKTDCTGDADCSPEGLCIAFNPVGSSESSGCAAAPNPTTRLPFFSLVVLFFRRRRRESP